MTTIIIISIFLFLPIVLIPAIKRRKGMREFEERLRLALEQDRKEKELLNSGRIPTDEHIQLYYKMYLKKFELDKDENNLWDVSDPMSFEDFEKRAKCCLDTVGGYRFIISRSMDVFMGGNSMMRFRDYRKMVEKKDD